MRFGIYKEVEAKNLAEALKKEADGVIVKVLKIDDEEEPEVTRVGF